MVGITWAVNAAAVVAVAPTVGWAARVAVGAGVDGSVAAGAVVDVGVGTSVLEAL
jgi:hypothetical protein